MKLLIVIGLMSLSACSRESSAPAPAAAKTRPGPTIVKPTEPLNTPRPNESQAEAEVRASIRMENLPCDRVIEMHAGGGNGQVGAVTCAVGNGKQAYVVDRDGRPSKR